ncbi:hypothetical protein [Orlajensenia leifsoniae]|uniref:Uncharacterized protein n=1 Tax=Orlajensenia leifsoniae TaxID=2561933 RepID=A0A4Y9QSJ7_9MICO|nr:hypothetical protein [Leifsonia flava]TFV95399.1 hypothetical protein E4M00_15245 [Leifsonia flava]
MSELIARANRLEKLAKAARDKEGDQAEIERLKFAVDKLSLTLNDLEGELLTRSALDPLQARGRIDLKVETPWAELKSFVETRGRPTLQRLQAANRKVSDQVDALRGESQSRWAEWATSEVRQLPRHLVTAMPSTERVRVETIIRELDDAVRKAARSAPTADGIRIFGFQVQRVREELGQIDLDESVLKVLERFTSPDGVPLLEITDAELDILRSNPAIAGQFVVRRQV